MKNTILENLKKLVGTEFDSNGIICAFEDFDNGNGVIVNDSNNNGYDYIAYINLKESTQYLIEVDKNNRILDVWDYE